MALDYADSPAAAATLDRSGTREQAAPIERQTESAASTYDKSAQGPGSLAHTDRAKELRAMVAALVIAPKHTPESFRDAMAAAEKAAPGLDRNHDYGAER